MYDVVRMGRASLVCIWSLVSTVSLGLTDVSVQVRPGAVQPGQIERQFEKPPEPSARTGTITIPAAGQTPPPNAEGIRFVLNDLTVDGVTAYRAEAIRAMYGKVLHTEVTLSAVYRIVDALTARYRNDGYILLQVIVPAQAVEGGVVRLQAVEGYVADVRVEGGSPALRERMRHYGEQIRASRPLTVGALERYVLLANDLPGVVAHAVLAPSTVPGASDLVLQVSSRPLAAELSTDDRGSRAQGPRRVSGDLDVNALQGGASRTELRGVSTLDHELLYASLAHDRFVGAGGGKFGVTASYVYSAPQELAVVPLNLTTHSETGTLTYSYPLVRSRARNLYVRGTLSAFDSTTRVFGIKDTVDRLRAARLGLTYDAADRLGGVNIADLEFSQGLPWLGASGNGDALLSRSTGTTDFRKLSLYAARLQPLPANWAIVLGLNAQYSLTDLLASELFSVGGELFGRGYDPSELLNDHGAAVKADLQYSWRLGGRTATTLVPYGFVDAGKVWQRTPFEGVESSQSAISAGLGARLSIGRRVSGFAELAKPLTRIVGQESNRKARIYAGLSVR